MIGLYTGKDVALLTQHGKESLINPVLEPAVGCRILLAKGFDTDQLGSFAGDIKRIDNHGRAGELLSRSRIS